MEKTRSIPIPFFFFISLLEGGAVMAVELIGAKLVAPFYGNSLYVWASVLGITLGGLSLGYFLGGRLSRKYPDERVLFYILILAAATVFWMAPLGRYVMGSLLNFSVIPATLIACLCFLFPPLLLFGMTSPVIINLITDRQEEAGRSSGSIYAISTIGGIIMTFFTGFWLIPEIGLTDTLFIVASVLLIPPVGGLFYKRRAIPFLLLLLTTWTVLLIRGLREAPEDQGKFIDILHRSEGLLGQLTVLDYIGGDGVPHRCMYVNYSAQTCMNLKSKSSDWPYVQRVAALASYHRFKKNPKALVCGLGGGLLVNELMETGIMNVDVVELDGRMKKLARKYFGMNRSPKVFVDDARHFIRTKEKKYDLVVFDLSISENPPSNIYTLSAFQEVKELLKEGGSFIIHYNNKLTGKGGRAFRSIGATLQKAGYRVRTVNNGKKPGRFAERLLFATPENGDQKAGEKRIFEAARPHLQNSELYQSPEDLFLDSISYKSGFILKDDRPRVHLLEANSISVLRDQLTKGLLQRMRRNGIDLLK